MLPKRKKMKQACEREDLHLGNDQLITYHRVTYSIINKSLSLHLKEILFLWMGDFI
jgi:hypothetical protein